MGYTCPRCGGEATRGASRVAQHVAGLVGLLLYMAFAPVSCAACGAIPRSEFSDVDRAAMTRNTGMLVLGAMFVLVLVIAVLAALNS